MDNKIQSIDGTKEIRKKEEKKEDQSYLYKARIAIEKLRRGGLEQLAPGEQLVQRTLLEHNAAPHNLILSYTQL
jgi:hypothetical protein